MTDECSIDALLDVSIGRLGHLAVIRCVRPQLGRFLSQDLDNVKEVLDIDLGILAQDQVLDSVAVRRCRVDVVEALPKVLLAGSAHEVVELRSNEGLPSGAFVDAYKRHAELLWYGVVLKRPQRPLLRKALSVAVAQPLHPGESMAASGRVGPLRPPAARASRPGTWRRPSIVRGDCRYCRASWLSSAPTASACCGPITQPIRRRTR